MIIAEHPWNGNENLIRHYSDANKMIEQFEESRFYPYESVSTGNRYEEAVDVYPCRYTYVETDEPIPVMEVIKDG